MKNKFLLVSTSVASLLFTASNLSASNVPTFDELDVNTRVLAGNFAVMYSIDEKDPIAVMAATAFSVGHHDGFDGQKSANRAKTIHAAVAKAVAGDDTDLKAFLGIRQDRSQGKSYEEIAVSKPDNVFVTSYFAEKTSAVAEKLVTAAAEATAAASEDELEAKKAAAAQEAAKAAAEKAERAAMLAAASKAKAAGLDEARAQEDAKAELQRSLEAAADLKAVALKEAAARKAELEEEARRAEDLARRTTAAQKADDEEAARRTAAAAAQKADDEEAARRAAVQKADDEEAARRAAAADQAELLKAAETLDQFKADFEEAFGDAKTKAIVSELNNLPHAELAALAQAADIDYDAIVAALSKVDVKPMLSALVHLNIIDDKTTLEGLIKSGNGFIASHGLLTVARLVPNFAAEGLDPNVLAAFKAIEEAISRDQYRQLGLTKPGDLDTYYYPTQQEINMYSKTLEKIREAEAALAIVRAHPKADATQIAVISHTVDQFKQMFTGIMAQASKLIEYVNTNFKAIAEFNDFDAVQHFVRDFETGVANDALRQKVAQQQQLEDADLNGLAAKIADAKAIKEGAEANEATLRAAAAAADKAHTDFADEANQVVDLGGTTGAVNVARVRQAAKHAEDAVADNARKITDKQAEVDGLEDVVADHERAQREAIAEKSKLEGERDAAALEAQAAEAEIGLKKPLLGKDGCIDHSDQLPRIEEAKAKAEAVAAVLDTDDKMKLAQFIVDNFGIVKKYQDAVVAEKVVDEKQAVVAALQKGTEPLADSEAAAKKLAKPLRDVYVDVSKIDSATEVEKFRDLVDRAAYVDQIIARVEKMTAETKAFDQLNAELKDLETAKAGHEQTVEAKAAAITAEEAKMDAAAAALDEHDATSAVGELKAARTALGALKAKTADLEAAKEEANDLLDKATGAAEAKEKVLLAEAREAKAAFDRNDRIITEQNDADKDGSYANLKAKQDELVALKLTDVESDVLKKLELARAAITSRQDFAKLSGEFKTARGDLFKAIDALAQ